MNIEDFRSYCLMKKGTEEGFPFDEHTLVFKVMGKMFAATNVSRPEFFVNLKCDPEKSIDLRERYSCIRPGYHMSKKHWNSIYVEEGIQIALFKELIDHSYDIVVSKLRKSDKLLLEEM